MTRQRERGFSLVELMMAMTITLVFSGAVYGLLTSGSNAFRREPELAERQQNIRVAMDLIARDVFNAGAGLPTLSQVFAITDPGGSCTGGLNGCGVTGTLGAGAASARGDGENTDVLETVAVEEQCPARTVCRSPLPGTAGLFVTREATPRCMRVPGLALLTDNAHFLIQPAQVGTGAPAGCDGAPTTWNGNLSLGASTGLPGSAASLSGATVFLYAGRVVRYRIAPGLDPADPTLPSLWRSETGRFTATGLAVAEPGETGFPSADSPWQLVARGVEDLQVEYLDGDGAAASPPVFKNQPQIVTIDLAKVVRRVRITLSARTSTANLAGQTTAGGGAPNAVRGQLSTTVTPRAALIELQNGN
jgi:prepilin-type N-terminal cleavage/methylation domain-containing protein